MLDSGSKKIILFGCGIIGHEMLEKLGADNVLCFCDNNHSLHGTTRWGKNIFSLEYIKNNYNGIVILICVRIDKAYNIAHQLDENEVFSYWIYPMIEKNVQDYPTKQLLEFLHNNKLMEKTKMMFYQNKISGLEKQLDYMKRHVDIKSLKPATGNLRKRQLDLAEFGSFISNSLGGLLNIKPFLYAGNLLGYVRHNGAIPWDDDLDFGLIRREYDLLCQYCLQHPENCGKVELSYGGKTKIVEFYVGHDAIYMLETKKRENGVQPLGAQFFSFDYYSEDYLFENFKKDATVIKINLCNFQTEEEKNNYVRNEMRKNKYVVEKSNLVYFGFDNMDAANLYSNGEMMDEEIVFPLKKAKYEGEEFWIPNKPEEFLTHIYKDIWDFPNDVGIIKHNMASEN